MRSSLLMAVVAFASPAAAHDFWVQPQAYRVEPRAETPLTLQVGHGPMRQRSQIPSRRIVRFAAVGPDGRATDLRGGLRLGEAARDGTLKFDQPGTQVVVFETDSAAQSHLPALRFNDYLAAEGLTPAIALRARTGRTGAEGSEAYGRVSKAIVQVGPGNSGQGQVTRPVGLSLEIVPEVSPYAVPRPSALPVRVIYRGRPLAGALVKLTDLAHDEAPVETHRTDEAGRARFAMPKAGTWLLNVIWTRPLKGAETDFETTFSSLSFGLYERPWR